MQLAGTEPSWQLVKDVGDDLNFALFVRDACGVPLTGGRFPARLAAPAEDAGRVLAPEQRRAAAGDWLVWWRRLIERRSSRLVRAAPPASAADQGLDPPAFQAMARWPGLQAACRAAFPAFLGWWSQPPLWGAKARLIEALQASGPDDAGVVRGLEERRARGVRPFVFGVDLVETEGSTVQRYGRRYAVVAANLQRDAAAYTAWLRQALDQLV